MTCTLLASWTSWFGFTWNFRSRKLKVVQISASCILYIYTTTTTLLVMLLAMLYSGTKWDVLCNISPQKNSLLVLFVYLPICISVRIDQDFNNYIKQFLLILFQSVMLCYTYIRCGLGLAALAHVRREELLLVLLWDLLTSSRVRPVTLGLIWTRKINWICLCLDVLFGFY